MFVYDEIIGHFGCKIDDRVYDITGDVTEKYQWTIWNHIITTETNRAERIIRDCINF